MPLIAYTPKRFTPEHRAIVDQANDIISTYAAQGYDLTLRQLYYQFVARDLLGNTQQNYKRLGGIISDARRAGLIDWGRIVDRTRHVRNPPAWDSPASIVAACARQFDVDWWANQDYRPEVWIEKDALVGVMEVACEPWHCAYLSCRGYTSDSEIWSSAQRMRGTIKEGKTPVVLHLGDHDPSGIDMTRDIEARLELFAGGAVEVRRLALNMDQVEQYNPPPNPAKVTDSRYEGYAAEHGEESWELDALNPETLTALIAEAMEGMVDETAWQAQEQERDEGRRLIQAVSDGWDRITRRL